LAEITPPVVKISAFIVLDGLTYKWQGVLAYVE
jgi:hypothetical protein